MNITLLGTGLMGYPMARRLCEAGHSVRVWNRTRAKAEGLAAHGASVHDTATGAVQGAECVITMLEHGGVVEQVLFEMGVAGAMKPGTVLIDMSSIKPAEARAHAERLGSMGIMHLDAPVSRPERWPSWWAARPPPLSAPGRSLRRWAAPPW
jgi:2-hydroxy-3-oxopropionate reductase